MSTKDQTDNQQIITNLPFHTLVPNWLLEAIYTDNIPMSDAKFLMSLCRKTNQDTDLNYVSKEIWCSKDMTLKDKILIITEFFNEEARKAQS